jgi:hypothetical protein
VPVALSLPAAAGARRSLRGGLQIVREPPTSPGGCAPSLPLGTRRREGERRLHRELALIEPCCGAQAPLGDLREERISIPHQFSRPWRSIEEVEFATLEWVAWFNNRRLLSSIGDVPPTEFEKMYRARQQSQTTEVGLN